MTTQECTHEYTKILMILIPGNRKDVYMFPKYIPQLKKYCTNTEGGCGKFLGFEKQTPELIISINKFLEKTPIQTS